jgi:outer membrane protein assembly factor BamA
MFRFFFIFLFFPGLLLAQEPDTSGSRPTPAAGEDVIVHSIVISGNKVTKDHILVREIPFVKGDTLKAERLPQLMVSIKENLLNTSLFNFVRVDTVRELPDRMNFYINVDERWYTWPVPIFEVQERNFNDWWERKDFARANYGFFLNRENFRGRKEQLSFYAQFGYTVKYGIAYDIPYLNRKRTRGMGFSFSYARNHEVAFMTVDNEQLYFKDPDEYIREEFTGKLKYYHRKGIHASHYFEAKYVDALVHDTVLSLTVDYFINNKTEMQFFGLDYSWKVDYRDSRSYPLKGYVFEFEATQLGLGILKGEKLEITNFYFTLRGYEKLAERWYISAGGKTKLSSKAYQPYYVQRGMGWKDYVRGYEYYVIDGQQYGLAKLGLKYELVKPHVQSIPLPFKKFNTFHYALYANIYGDAGYVQDRQYSGANPLANSFLYGYGAGIDYVTYYDVTIRLEASINRMKELGFFVHFNAGI